MSESTNPPRAAGQRAAWTDVPERIVAAVNAAMGAPVVTARSFASGFSPGVAATIETASGDRAFVKAVSAVPNPDSPRFHRREIRVNRALPDDPALPVPRMRWSLDEGGDGWVVLLFDAIDGREPHQPWVADELSRAIAALDVMATHLTPSPIDAHVVGTASEWSIVRTNFWRLRDTPEDRERLDPWAQRFLDGLIALCDDAPAAVAGETLLHNDLRADNIVMTEDRVFIVDWPHARVGAAWLDPLFMAPSVAMHGGGDPDAFLMRCASAQGVDQHRIDAALASVAGFFTSAALEPDVPGLPGLRAFQAAQGDVARRWLAARMGWA
ncbi:MAG: aminoglycoside phosphotransferase family protein [Thermomicrobiales bacterium]